MSKRTRLTAEQRRELIESAATEVFAERGYHAASIDEIARRSGVSAPIVYDHFESKQDLHTRLLERHRDQLLAVWREHLLASDPPDRRIPRALDAWARYVEGHPFAWQMLFRETTGEPEVQKEHRRVQAEARGSLAPLLAAQPGADRIAVDPRALEMAVELIRSGLTGLALWWHEHRDVPREQIVATAMNVLWIGFERLGRGERWDGSMGPARAAPPPARARSAPPR